MPVAIREKGKKLGGERNGRRETLITVGAGSWNTMVQGIGVTYLPLVPYPSFLLFLFCCFLSLAVLFPCFCWIVVDWKNKGGEMEKNTNN